LAPVILRWIVVIAKLTKKFTQKLEKLLNIKISSLKHFILEEIAYELVKKGIIIFNKETNKYKLNE